MNAVLSDAMEEDSDEEGPAPTGPATAEQGSEPNPILFIEGVPAEATADMLSTLFQQLVLSTLISLSAAHPSVTQVSRPLLPQAPPNPGRQPTELGLGLRAVRHGSPGRAGQDGPRPVLGLQGRAAEGLVGKARLIRRVGENTKEEEALGMRGRREGGTLCNLAVPSSTHRERSRPTPSLSGASPASHSPCAS